MSGDRFAEDFVWGVATAAYQIEGAVTEDGRGESIWDRFSATPGKVHLGHTGEVACDHYHRWPEDVRLLQWLGVDAYRFSIAWPRVMPAGGGPVNQAGLDFYDRLTDALLDAGITPFPTLYHWDLPQSLEDEGGWLDRNTAHAFAEYTSAVVDRLGDRIDSWMTLNEPWVSSMLGYATGEHAPGRIGGRNGAAASHHLLLAHGLSVEVLRSAGARVGIVLNQEHKIPASSHPLDVAEADLADQRMNLWFLDPLCGLGYPEGAVVDRGWDMAEVHPGDLDLIAAPLDQIGLNYYTSEIIADETVSPTERADPVPAPHEFTDMAWPVDPGGIVPLLTRLRDRGFDQIYITENGAAYPDHADAQGAVDDQDRISFLRRHFDAVAGAIDQGVGVRGYFVWSLMDNFEWAHGYDKRFGLVRVDYESLERTPKASAHWFREWISKASPPG